MIRTVVAGLFLLSLVASLTPLPTCGSAPAPGTALVHYGSGPSDGCGAAPNLLSCASGHCPALIHSTHRPAAEPAEPRVMEWTPLAPATLSLPPEPPPPEA
ncbi:MAG: hypothetical protein ACREMO_01060 [Gemmatimonadales bacterium]